MTTPVRVLSPQAKTPWKGLAFTGYTVIALTFGGAAGWAAISKVDRAVVAPASVSIETNRKTVQHLEGGLVKEILIREGQQVNEGDTLFVLDKVQAGANDGLLKRQLMSSLALEARLLAERDEAPTVIWPAELTADAAENASLIADQSAQFRDRKLSLDNQTEVLKARINQLETECEGIFIEKDSTEKQVAFIDQELNGLHKLQASALVTSTRVFAMEREHVRLQGTIGKLISDAAKAQGNISEIKVQIEQLKQKYREEVGSSLLDARQKIAELREKVSVSSDILRRVEVKAPRTGHVQNLKVFTKGQVLRGGEPLLDIVPDDEPLIIQAHFSPTDIDGVSTGQTTEIKFPSFKSRQVPYMSGELLSVSQDKLSEEGGKNEYYLGIISIKRADIPEPFRTHLRAGMPAEVIVKGGEKTVLQYLVDPLAASLHKTFIEQ